MGREDLNWGKNGNSIVSQNFGPCYKSFPFQKSSKILTRLCHNRIFITQSFSEIFTISLKISSDFKLFEIFSELQYHKLQMFC